MSPLRWFCAVTTVLCVLAHSSSADPFSADVVQTEEQGEARVEQALAESGTEALRPLCDAVGTAMERGMWRLSRKLVSGCAAKSIKVEQQVHRTVTSIRRELAAVTQQLQGGALSTISPSFQWAQSLDSVFLNVKFAHK